MNNSIEQVISKAKSQLRKYDKDVSDVVGITNYCSALMYNSADLANNIDEEIVRMTEIKENFISQIDEYCATLFEKRNKILSLNNKEGE